MVHHVLHEVSSDIRTLLSFVTAVVGHSAMSHHARSGAGNHVRHASHRGSRSPAYRRTNRGRGNYCILDCIFNFDTSTYYVLDLLCWKVGLQQPDACRAA